MSPDNKFDDHNLGQLVDEVDESRLVANLATMVATPSVNPFDGNVAIVGEPTELKVCHTHKGQLCMHIKTFGKASHSSVPEMGINAISLMADVIKGIERYANDLAARPGHPVCGHARVNPGVIKGGFGLFFGA